MAPIILARFPHPARCVVLDECADMEPKVCYEVVRPMLADRKGWAIFIGTSKGKNEFWKADATWLFAFVRRCLFPKNSPNTDRF
jgi:hypothetical protein